MNPLFHDITFVTEKPGSDTDKPLSGYEGKALRAALSRLDFNFDAIDYLSLWKARYLGKGPTESDIEEARSDLLKSIEVSNPSVVIICGDPMSKLLLGKGFKSKNRSQIYQLKTPHATFTAMPISDPSILNLEPDGFRSLAEDLQKVKRILGGEKPVIDPEYDNYILVNDSFAYERLISNLWGCARDQIYVAVDIETTSLSPFEGVIRTIGFSWSPGTAYVLNYLWARQDEQKVNEISKVLQACKCSFHNGMFDVYWLRHYGINCKYSFDTMLAHYLLDETRGTHGLKQLSTLCYNAPDYSEAEGKIWDTDDMETLRKYNGADCDYTIRLTYDLEKEMNEESPELRKVLDEIILPGAELFIEMQEHGLLIDSEYLHELGEGWKKELLEIEEKIYKYPEASAGFGKSGLERANLNSPIQVATLMFDRLHLKPMVSNSDKPIGSDILARETAKVKNPEAQEFFRTQSSKQVAGTKPRSTGIFMLYYLSEQHEIPLLLVRHRLLAKRVGSYYDGIVDRMGEECRIRPSYRMHGTKTGRLSSSDPNLHGVPREYAIKRMFIADPGYVLIDADYSQAEVRMVAHFAKDAALIKALSETDIHTGISKQLFELTDHDLEVMDPEERKQKRRAAKTIAFGLIYGRSAKGLAPQLGVSKTTAEAYMVKFFEAMPDVQRWIGEQKQRAMREHESVSLYGRKRRFDYWPEGGSARNELLRQSVNAPIQSSVSDMTLLAMIRTHKKLRGMGINTYVNGHIHDAFLLQVPEEDQDTAIQVIRDEMMDVGFETDVPFTCDINVGPSWGDMHGV